MTPQTPEAARDATWNPAPPLELGDHCALLRTLPAVLGGFADCTVPDCGEKVRWHTLYRRRADGWSHASLPTYRCDSHKLGVDKRHGVDG